MMLMRIFAGFGEAGDDDFDVVGIVDIFEFETFAFGGGLSVDVSEGEERCEEAFCFTGHVLDLIKVHFGDDTVEESGLFGVDNAFSGDDPDVQPVVGEFREGQNKHHEKVGKECEREKRAPENILENGGVSKCHGCSYNNGKRYHDSCKCEDTK